MTAQAPSPPDPSALTTDALHREVSGLEQRLTDRLNAVLALMRETEKRFDERFVMMGHEREKNFQDLQSDIMVQVNHRSELDDQKFGATREKLSRLDDRRIEHDDDHERERDVAKDTAHRMEREVSETAHRIERRVEEEANRLEQGVKTALAAVAETAQVHSDAHLKEHIAHESIHTSEKEQVAKAERASHEAVGKALDAVGATAMVHADAHAKEHQAHERIHAVEKVQVDKAEDAMNKRLQGMNEFRAALQDLAAKGVSRELLESNVKELDSKLDLRVSATGARITQLEQRAAAETGRSEGLSQTGRVVVGAVSLVVSALTIVGIILAFNG